MSMCVYMCVPETTELASLPKRVRIYIYTYMYTCTYIYINIYICYN